MGGLVMVFVLASLGLPGLGNFVAEFLVLIGVFHKSIAIASIATFGLVAATVYSLWLIQKVFFGKSKEDISIADVSVRELLVTTVMIAALLFLGLYPQPVLNTVGSTFRNMKIEKSPAFTGMVQKADPNQTIGKEAQKP
jgi:NADH-quinone oxidoreductase subunit M